MAHIEVPYLEKHHKSYRYRRRVPPDLVDQIGRKSWIKTWRRRVPLDRVHSEAKTLAESHDRIIDCVRAGELVDPAKIARAQEVAHNILSMPRLERIDLLQVIGEPVGPDMTAVINATETGGTLLDPTSMFISAVYNADKALHEGKRHEKPIRLAINSFIAFAGDQDIRKIRRFKVEEWLKREGKTMSPGTVNRRLTAIGAVVQRAYLRHEIDRQNPFRRHRIEGAAGGADDRLPLNRKMVAMVDAYLNKSKRLGHETVNILRLIKCSGAGPAEIGGLAVSDVVLDHEIPHILIRPNAIRGLKVRNSNRDVSPRERTIPLIGEALSAAQDAYKRALARLKNQNPDQAQLFDSFSRDRGANPISAKLLYMIRKAGIPKSTRLVAYSYRHTLEEALRSAHVPEHVQKRILGHSAGSTTDRYGSPKGRLAETHDALIKAMEHFGDVEESIYRSDERV